MLYYISIYITELINRSKFGVDWFSSFGYGEMQNLMFAIGTTTGPYHCSATVLARDSDSVFAISCQIVTRATCVSHIRYLFICSKARHYVRHHGALAKQRCCCTIKLTITIGNLSIYNDECKYPLDSFLCHNLFAEL